MGPDDAEAFAQEIRRLADDPERRHRLGSSGRRWVVEHASPSAVGAAYAELMDLIAR